MPSNSMIQSASPTPHFRVAPGAFVALDLAPGPDFTDLNEAASLAMVLDAARPLDGDEWCVFERMPSGIWENQTR